MEINTVFEIKAISDFDIRYTVCIMVHKDKLRVYDILKEFYDIKGIKSNDGLSLDMLSEINGEFIEFLESKGFTELKTNKVLFTY